MIWLVQADDKLYVNNSCRLTAMIRRERRSFREPVGDDPRLAAELPGAVCHDIKLAVERL